jgi:hypothetical protein
LALLVQYLRYCHSACSVSFFHCSLFQLVVLHVGHVLASNCDLYFGYLLNFAHLHSILFHIHIHIVPILQLHIHTLHLSAAKDPCNLGTLFSQVFHHPPVVPSHCLCW